MEYHEYYQTTYAIGMIVKTLVEALGMMSDNLDRYRKGETIAYPYEAFEKLIEDNGCCHNAIVENFFPKSNSHE